MRVDLLCFAARPLMSSLPSHCLLPPVLLLRGAACLLLSQDREGEGSRAESAFTSGMATPGAAAFGGRPGSPGAGSPGAGSLLATLLASSYQPLIPGVGQLRHGSEGWKCLETSMRALQQLMEGTGQGVAPLVNAELLELLCRCGAALVYGVLPLYVPLPASTFPPSPGLRCAALPPLPLTPLFSRSLFLPQHQHPCNTPAAGPPTTPTDLCVRPLTSPLQVCVRLWLDRG